MKRLLEKKVTKEEFKDIEEKRNRMFRVVYSQDYLFKFEKTFQKKKYVKRILDDKHNHEIKIYVGDVIVEE